MTDTRIEIAASLAGIAAADWDALTGGNPTLSHAWLQSMIDAGCTAARTGWQPQFVLLTRDRDGTPSPVAALPLYVKGHSYGEYVFDWSWAEAYHRAGMDYYPKLCVAVPFTPCQGPRLLAAGPEERERLLDVFAAIVADSDVSSAHVLFADAADAAVLASRGWLVRQSVQFHWRNAGYADFDAFLASMTHDKRKRIRQERKRVVAAGVTLTRKTGRDITSADWDFFFRCYAGTYHAHHSTPYLNRAFFGLVGVRMVDSVLMTIATREGEPIAASLCLFNGSALYGRYWGATETVPGLHFETCYYQPLTFCIERGISLFEGGAQGAHKLARGFLPVVCQSYHWIKDPRFRDAIAHALSREDAAIMQAVDELDERAPYKSP